MKLDPEIDYTDKEAVRAMLVDIEAAIKDNGLKKEKLCDMVGICRETYSKFKRGDRFYVSEDRVRLIVSAINKFHIEV